MEIDESKFGKRKYHRGRNVEGHWVFGGIERGSRESFMVAVPDRSKNTLMPIITQYIRPGTTVISDEWRSYNDIGISGYTHQTVNHSLNFMDPTTGAHTNGVEGFWSCTKRMMRKQGVMSTSSDLFPTYLFEFFGGDLGIGTCLKLFQNTLLNNIHCSVTHLSFHLHCDLALYS